MLVNFYFRWPIRMLYRLYNKHGSRFNFFLSFYSHNCICSCVIYGIYGVWKKGTFAPAQHKFIYTHAYINISAKAIRIVHTVSNRNQLMFKGPCVWEYMNVCAYDVLCESEIYRLIYRQPAAIFRPFYCFQDSYVHKCFFPMQNWKDNICEKK